MPSFTDVLNGADAAAATIQQVVDALKGTAGKGVPISLTALNDALSYALSIRNNDASASKAVVVYKADNTILFQIDKNGVLASPDGTLAASQLATLAGAQNFTGKTYAATITGAAAAARFVGGTVSGAPVAGTFLVGDFVIDQSAEIWVCTVAGSPGTWLGISGGKIAQVGPLVATQATLDFATIPATYRNLQLVIQGRITAGNDIAVSVQFNADTAANYDWQRLQAASTAVAASEGIAATSAVIGQFAQGTATIGGQLELLLANYAGTTLQKTGRSSGTHKDTNGSGNVYVEQGGIHWRSTAAINAIKVLLASSTFEVGTVATLYGQT